MKNKPSKEQVDNLIYLLKQNSFDLLVSKTADLINQFPDSILLLNLSGIANANLKNYKKSIECFEKILSIDNNSTDAYYNLGNLKQKTGDMKLAKFFFNKTIELNKNFYQAYNSLGIIYKFEKNFKQAPYFFKCAHNINQKHYQSLINLGLLSQLQSNNLEAINYFVQSYMIKSNKFSLIYLGNSLAQYRFIERRPDLYQIIYDLITTNNLVSPTNIIKSVISLIVQEDEINKILNTNKNLTSVDDFNHIINEISKYPFFIEIIKLCPLTDLKFEKLFIKIRYYLLLNISKIKLSEQSQKFLYALALQCFVNEFVYNETEIETEKIKEYEELINKNLSLQIQPNTITLLCFCLYRNLNNYKWSAKLKFSDNLIYLKKTLIVDDIIEKENISNIEKFKKVTDHISLKVQNQYEENPYPRWIKMRTEFDDLSIKDLIENNELKIIKSDIREVFKPDILIAGCGTGQHAIYTALNYKNSNVLALDLSLSSLAYAKRKVDEYEIKNINFIHSDLSDVKNFNKKFDIIESVGVLHHMNNPYEGMRCLVDVLKDFGLINLGLYSKYARKHISKIRQDIQSKNIVPSNIEIKKYRNYIFNSNNNENIMIKNSKDFYTTSSARDLLFHVQEHQFDLIEIKNYLKKLNLFFCGFDNSNLKTKFKSIYNFDDIYDLEKWDEFERKNPNSFDGMYQFYCQKI